MVNIELDKYPNQEFQFIADGVEYEFRIHFWNGMMFCSLSINGERKLDSVKCISGKWLIPFDYILKGGNFRFECVDPSEYPDYNNFGISCNLIYYTKEEFEVLNVQ